MNGGRFEFDDGGSYCGGWEEAKAHGHGVCTGPQGKGEYAGAWHYGFEVSGVYTWPSGNTYAGQWQNGKRHGLGVETRGRWIYKGDWTSGSKGRYGVRSSTTSQARYAGTWSANYHDGYGSEVYVDSGSYQGQWLRGMRHGFGVRKSATHGVAAKLRKAHNHVSLTSLRSGQVDYTEDDDENRNHVEGRGGFVLKANSAAPAKRRRSLSERSLAMKRSLLSGLRIKKQHSTGDIHQKVSNYTTGSLRSSGSTMSCASDDSNKDAGNDPEEEQIDDNVTEGYCGEWKNDARSGYGVCERSDGLKYHGEWANNMKNGYGVTTLKDGTREEGKYKNNVLIMSTKKKGVLFVRSSRLRERVESSEEAAKRSAEIAKQKADIAASRTSTAKERSEQASHVSKQARDDADMARIHAKQFDPNFKQPGTEAIRRAAASSTDSPRTQMSSDHSSRSSKPPSFDHTGDMATDPLAYTNHVQPQRLPHQSSTSSSNLLHVQQQPQVSFDESSFHPSSLPNSNYHPQQMQYAQYAQQSPSSSTATQPDLRQMPQGMMQQQYQQQQMMPPGGYAAYPQQPMNQQPMMNQQQMFNQQQMLNQQQLLLNQQQPSSSGTTPQGLPPLPPSGRERDSVRDSVISTPSTSAKDSIATPTQRPPSPSSSTPKITPPSRNPDFQTSHVSLADDHYEQYVVRSRRAARDESKTRAARELSNGVGLNRRSTLASAHDRVTPLSALHGLRAMEHPQTSLAEGDDPMGSLPNLAQLEEQGLRMRREEAARLASDRRQQAAREEEEREALRGNPLRYLMHPSLWNTVRQYKVLIILVAINAALILFFFAVVSQGGKRRRSPPSPDAPHP